MCQDMILQQNFDPWAEKLFTVNKCISNHHYCNGYIINRFSNLYVITNDITRKLVMSSIHFNTAYNKIENLQGPFSYQTTWWVKQSIIKHILLFYIRLIIKNAHHMEHIQALNLFRCFANECTLNANYGGDSSIN